MDPNAADIPSRAPARTLPATIGIVGAGRMGHALARSLHAAGVPVDGPARRGEIPRGEAILLCVPDAEIENAAGAVAGAAPLVGHVSGATPLSALEPAGAEGFGLHPLQTVSGPGASFAGCGCAIAGTSAGALATARGLAHALGMSAFEIADSQRAAYHAAASVASNFLVTLEATAERIAGEAGLSPDQARALLAPLVRTTVENWAEHGPERALTGPVARGDEATVSRQRDAVPEPLLPLFDALVAQTRELAGVPA